MTNYNDAMPISTLDQICDHMQTAARNKKWLCCTFRIATPKGEFSLGIKSFGKWVQRIECCGLVDSIPEQKTYKALRAEFIATVNRIVSCL